ncbi:MAG: 5-formyltetrahydrofolate cyclo-ligase [Syntrophomonas sp.]|uniref:5-formyltetrahydrofolate cyclo-ligase n=1 Tax=Syntrophomonas sp. TaxID=2053627 RepID=UPI002622393D|nr:5-formyltetrahydrofolate cyclo-ligase [Syntrophomonas sp.]MDD2509814.1 5-formyltetrahydrofolate cyclo-ligase [Syntrophomonas sp.]MDD3879960.1 5-formyltetrahydrofolate cyclo-ligase [Syntrophomonas sp.]MDD4625626.1 5-formyltetrahydrofolate cyclo-ligase [Syntrophomonas sp.]
MEDRWLRRQSLRKGMLESRNAMSPSEVEEFSRCIGCRLEELEPLRQAKSIMGFAAVKNEVDLRPFLKQQRGQGKRIFLPRVESAGEMAAVEFQGWEQCASGPFGIREPLGKAVPAAEIDVVLVPGLVFDARGYRLGYGKGYYDRFLAGIGERVFKCGVCYEFQLVDDSFPDSLDVPVHWIVTEKSELVVNWEFF